MEIKYLVGDATAPVGEGVKVIVHVCNDIGSWGGGFVMSLSARWSLPKREYLAHMRNQGKLGQVSFAQVEKDIWVINMIAQHSTRTESPNEGPWIRYQALQQCLFKASQKARKLKASFHMPRIGCDRAGGTWERVLGIIEEVLKDFKVFVYDLPH